MTTLVERVSQTWQKIKGAKPKLSPPVYLLPSHVDDGASPLGSDIVEDQHYFEVRVHQIGLALGRKWATTYEPMVLTLTEFNYDGVRQSVPSMVGPGVLEQKGYKVPEGMLFLDTRVAGLHPYRGGDLSLTVILSRVERDNRVRSLLKALESTTSAFPLGSALTPYLKMGQIALDGIDDLVGNGDVVPVLGFSRQFAPKGNGLQPQFIALLDEKVDRETLWIKEGGLVRGPSRDEAVPIDDMDFVLLSVTGLPERTDVEVLSFYPQYKQVLGDATKTDKPSWERTRANMLSLYQALVLSADLTRAQADTLIAQFKTDVKKTHDTAVDLAGMAPAEPDEITSKLNAGLKILEM